MRSYAEKSVIDPIGSSPTEFAAREVSPGKVIDGNTEILSGLKPGDAIVVNGSFHLKSILRSKQLGEE